MISEKWLQIPCAPKYEINRRGDVRNIKTGRLLKWFVLNNGRDKGKRFHLHIEGYVTQGLFIKRRCFGSHTDSFRRVKRIQAFACLSSSVAGTKDITLNQATKPQNSLPNASTIQLLGSGTTFPNAVKKFTAGESTIRGESYENYRTVRRTLRRN